MGARADQGLANRVTLDVVEADLVRVVDMLRNSSHANIVINRPDEIKCKVSAKLQDVTLESALRAVVDGSGIKWWKDKDGVYYINSNSPIPAAPETVAPVPVAEAPKKIIKTEKIKLRYVNPSVVIKQLGLVPSMSDPSIMMSGPAHEPTIPTSGLVGQANAQIGTYDPTRVMEPGYVPPPPSIPSMSELPAGGPLVAGRTADAVTPGPYVAGQGYPGGPTRGRTDTPNIGGPNTGNATNQQGQGRLLPDDIYLVMPYEIDNSLVVRGTDVAIDELKQVIRMLDIAPKQVQIKAEFVELTVNDESALGLDWAIQTLDSDVTATGMAPGGNISFRFASGNISAVLSALKTSGQAKVKNSPVITTMNNVAATINVGTAFIYFVTTIQTPVQGNTLTTANPQVMPINTGLWVLPRVNGDGSITVTIQPQVEDTAGFAENPISKDRIPIRAYRTLTTTRRIGDGETIVIGGLNTAHDTKNEKGIPFLKDLPIIGNLFRSNQISTNESELLIFLTPTVLPEPMGSSGPSTE